MISPNAALYRQARDFFFAELLELYRWDAVKVGQPEENPEIDFRRVLARDHTIPADSRFREMLRLTFGPWELILQSSEEAPPLGLLQLRPNAIVGDFVVTGPPDSATWAKIATHIKTEQKTRELQNVHW